MFYCELCDFITNSEYKYKDHLQSKKHFLLTGEKTEESNYKCIPCNATFTNIKYLKLHEKTKKHLNNCQEYKPKKYVCDLCNYTTYVSNNFYVHRYRHRKRTLGKIIEKETALKKLENFQDIKDDDLLKVKISEEIVRLYENGKNPNNFFNYSYYARKNVDLTNQELNNFLYELKAII